MRILLAALLIVSAGAPGSSDSLFYSFYPWTVSRQEDLMGVRPTTKMNGSNHSPIITLDNTNGGRYYTTL